MTGQRPTKIRWSIFTLACLTSWFLYLHRYTWNFIRPGLQEEFGFNNKQLEGLYSVFSLFYGIGQIPGGIICDYFGPHLFLSLCILLWSLILPGFGFTGNLYGLGGLRGAFGIAQAGCYPGLAHVTRSWFPMRQRTTVQGWVASFFGRSGGAMSSIIMGTLLMGYFGFGWRAALYILSAVGLVFAVLFWLTFRNSPAEHPQVNDAERKLIVDDPTQPPAGGRRVLPFGRALKNVNMLIFIFQQSFSAGADAIYSSVMGSYFAQQHGASFVKAGIFVSLPLWGGAVGGMFGGTLNDLLIRWTGNRRWARSGVGFTGKFTAGVLMFVAIQQTNPTAAAIALFVVKFFSDWSQPTTWGTCTDIGGRFSATVFSILNTSGNLGAFVCPIGFGFLLDAYTTTAIENGVEVMKTDFNPLLVTVALMYFVCAVCWFFVNCTKSLETEAAGEAKLG